MKEKYVNPFNCGKICPFKGRSEITDEQVFPVISATACSYTVESFLLLSLPHHSGDSIHGQSQHIVTKPLPRAWSSCLRS